MTMAIKKRRDGLVTADAPTTTTPFDVRAFIRDKDRKSPGFAAAVEAEIAGLKIDEQLREARKTAELSQAVVAERMGVTQSAIAQLERADPGRMEVRTLAKMATAMGYSLTIELKPRRPPTRRVVARKR